MRRLFILTALCLRFHEPVLLVGETGCGKTTVCQMLAQAMQRQLHVVNCHQNTEASDILGGQRPVRNRQALVASAQAIISDVISKTFDGAPLSDEFSSSLLAADSPESLRRAVATLAAADPASAQSLLSSEEQMAAAGELLARAQDLFAWHDGPLVQAMRQGAVFLMDELNLADDSVLERLNSDLEPPALRNRFTELWAPTTTDTADLQMILAMRLAGIADASACIAVILGFVEFLGQAKLLQHALSLRDYLFWADFVVKTQSCLDARTAVVHGACLVLLDSIGTQGSVFAASIRAPAEVKAECIGRLRAMVGWTDGCDLVGVVPSKSIAGLDLQSLVVAGEQSGKASSIGVAPFFVSR
ncbi:AAA ATPase midasin, partial [Coemansia aciculifera]